MRQLFGSLYTFLFFSYVVTALFIVFHLVRYSLSRSSATFMTVLFLSVLVVLLFTNAMIFFSLPLDGLFPANSSF